MPENCEIIKVIWAFAREALAPLLGVLAGAYISTRHDRRAKKKEYALKKLDEFDEMIKEGLREISELPRSTDGTTLAESDVKNANRSRVLKFKRQFSIGRHLVSRLMEANGLPEEALKEFERIMRMLMMILTDEQIELPNEQQLTKEQIQAQKEQFKDENWWLPNETSLASWRSKYTLLVDSIRIDLLK